MKKKITITLVTLLVCLLTVLLIWNLTDCATLHIGGKTAKLPFSDSWQIRSLLIMEKTDFIELACGFSENCSIEIGGLTYCLAEDSCNSVYIKELDFYYTIPEENHVKLDKFLSEYAKACYTTN